MSMTRLPKLSKSANDSISTYLENFVAQMITLVAVLHIHLELLLRLCLVIQLDHIVVVGDHLVDVALVLGEDPRLWSHQLLLHDHLLYHFLYSKQRQGLTPADTK
jgi:hypothetical protein